MEHSRWLTSGVSTLGLVATSTSLGTSDLTRSTQLDVAERPRRSRGKAISSTT